ncbi:MAG: efflux RND transporter periplasmic adaptor subunit [Myxococcaceae bacterium]
MTTLTTRALFVCFAAALLALGCSRKQEGGQEAGEPAGAHGPGEGASREGVITLSPEAVASAELKIGRVERRALATGLTVPARIAFTQTGVAKVAARVPGRLVGLEVQLGQKVKKGQVLGFLESSALGQAQADYLSAATRTRVAEGSFRREKDLVAKGISSEREMREAESAFVSAQAEMNAAEGRLHALGLSDPDIRALKADEHYSSRFPERSPIDGTVVEISGTLGQSVEGTTSLFTVGDLSTLWVLLDVYEAQLAVVRVGQPVYVTVAAFPDKRHEGRVEYIGDVVDERSRTVPVRVVVSNFDGQLKPGMFANAEIGTGASIEAGRDEAPRLVVPRDAVQKVGEDQVVFVPSGANEFKPVKVRVGATSAKEAEITSGLEAGAEVVTHGAFILKSELSKESMGEE